MALSDYEPIFKAAADEWNLDPNLLKAVAAQESAGNPKAVSGKNAQGLMQIIPETQKYLGITDPNDPVQSIYGAAKYLSEGLDKEGTPEGALLYYHGGPDWRNAYGPESKAYVPSVTAHYKQFSAAKPAATTAAAPEAAPLHAMSDDDFLKSTGGAPGAAPADDDAAFLARTGAKVAAAADTAPNPNAGANEYGITDDPQQFNKPPTAAEKGVADTISAIGQGAKEGFGSSPLGLSDSSKAKLADIGVYNKPGEFNPLKAINAAVVNGGAALGDLALRGGNALLGAYQHGIAQAGESAGVPQLGRDLAVLPEAFPTGDVSGGTALPHWPVGETKNPLVREVSQEASDRLAAPLSASFRDNPGVTTPRMVGETEANPLASPTSSTPLGWTVDDRFGPTQPTATTQSPARITAAQVQARDGVGGVEAARRAAAENAASSQVPQSVGASASSSTEAVLTPKQVQAYRSTAEGQKLLEPQTIGAQDRNQYVYGSNPNTAEIEQSVNTAREQKALGMQSPEVSQEAREVAQENNDARMQHFAQTAGSDVDVANAKEVRDAQAKKDLEAAFGNKGVSDAQPVADTIDSIMSGARNSENTALQQYIKPLAVRLQNADGTLKSDPEQLYGLREDINRMMSKAAKAKDPTLDHVNSELQQIKSSLDGVIEQGAPGYQQYLKNYSDASRGIDQMEALQGFENKLTDSGNRMTYPKVQNMMRQIVDARQSPGLNKFKSIDDDTMQRLWALRDDLRRSASAQELARTPGGSDSAQNFLDIVKGVGKSGADMAAHGLIATHAGPLGNLVYHGAKNALSSKLSARSAAKQTARGMELLRPKTPLHNPLAEP